MQTGNDRERTLITVNSSKTESQSGLTSNVTPMVTQETKLNKMYPNTMF